MGLREATLEDLDTVVAMGVRFASVSHYLPFATEERIRTFIKSLIEAHNGIVLIHEDVGFLLASRAPLMIGDIGVATEFAWWVEPEFRGHRFGQDMFDAFEAWAKNANCGIITMASSVDHNLGKFYNRNGYELCEVTYMKVLD